jgi:hypothetical protein
MDALVCRCRSAGVLTLIAAALAVGGGCIIPGINDGADEGALDGAARTDVSQAARRLAPLADDGLPSGFLSLAWTSVPGATQYDVYFGVDPNPPLVASVTVTSLDLIDLPDCATHYWRVVARSDTQAVSSPTWTFKTRCP